MAFLQKNIFFVYLVTFNVSFSSVFSRGPIYRPPIVERLTDRFRRVPITQGMSTFYGTSNIHMRNNGSYADLILDKVSGSGLISKNRYHHGFFSAAIKLPMGITSGVVLAFYLSNSNVFPQNHDEIDFELLGHERRKQWVLQTNVYGNGSVKTGREEKFYLWFDPTQQFHQYSILWNNYHTVFLVDNIPVREVIHKTTFSSIYPSKPMSLYTTIWDASQWATHGGKYPVNYNYSPFVASFGELEMEGCLMQATNSSSTTSLCSKSSTLSSLDPVEGEEYMKLSNQQMIGLNWARGKHMFYSYCKDIVRYKVLPPECNA